MKETKIEKLILDLSTRWDCSPREAVDRLNSMDESEINKLIKSMAKKFQEGGKTEEVKTIFGDGSPIRAWMSKGFFSGNPTIRLQKYSPRQKFIGVEYADNDAGFLERTIDGNDTTYVGHGAVPLMLVGEQKVKTTSKNQNDPMLPKLRKAFNVLGYKNGGFIDCLRNGGTIPTCKCGKKIDKGASGMIMDGDWDDYHTIINAPGDTLRFKQYYSGPVTMQTHPEGGITYTQSYDGGINYMYNKDYKPSWWEKLWYGMKPVDRETEQNWQQLIKNHKNDPAVKDKTQKKQMGGTIEDEGPVAGRIPRSSMFDAAREFMPDVDRKFVRQAYRAAKRQGREAGNTGTYLRQDARDRVIEKFRNYADSSPVNMPQIPVLSTDIEIEDTPIVINDNPFTNLNSSIPAVQKIDKFGGSFNSAFRSARNSKLDKFYYNGPDKKAGWYTTALDTEDPIIKNTGSMRTIAQQAKQGASNAVNWSSNGTFPGSLYKNGGKLKK